ncbi:MAG TPA: undecaprenyl-diphosphate phosphatase [Geminicoccaceae bacterium]|nr:undecaprenyl-diphosphate phosphatase [Geminicoccus sp.]HMU50193.1 undecaprenyl-diphosphate phosphatase [Geminicoccaceae bacterium]
METGPSLVDAIILGIVEGLTEFLPVSSTGHLIIAGWFLGFEGPKAEVFHVAIQVGAILAVCGLYFARLWPAVIGLAHDPAARRFALSVILAFLPAAALGVLLHPVIKMLFSPMAVAISLIVGGIAILAIERSEPRVRHPEAQALPPATSLGIGLFQCLSLVPGVSRAGATIMGAVLLGVDRRAAAEFSFFLAIPTIIGAAVFELWQSRDILEADDLGMMLVGGFVSLLAAVVCVKAFIAFLQRHDFTLFGWYRIVAGIVMLAILWTTGT